VPTGFCDKTSAVGQSGLSVGGVCGVSGVGGSTSSGGFVFIPPASGGSCVKVCHFNLFLS